MYLITDPYFLLPSCEIFHILLKLKLCFDKMNIVCFLLGNSPALEFYTPTFRNTFRRRGITQKEPCNIQKTVKVWHQKCTLFTVKFYLTNGRKCLSEGQDKDTVKLPSCIVYITGCNFNWDSCWIPAILQHCMEYSKVW